MKIVKFGGTSVGSAPALSRTLQLLKLITKQDATLVVVVSALAQVTNQLTAIYESAATGQHPEAALSALWQRHQELAIELKAGNSTIAKMATLMQHLQADVKKFTSQASSGDRFFAQILSYGELLSSTLVTDLLAKIGFPVVFVDARSLIKTNHLYRAATVIENLTNQQIKMRLLPVLNSGKIVVTQGFIASTSDTNDTSLLGREGSDYSAALFGAALMATEIQIWTDVDGLMTGDPRYITNAELIRKLSYEEAKTLARFGAKVLHPETFAPAEKQRIPIKILNSTIMKISQPGTLITAVPTKTRQRRIALKEEVMLLTFADDLGFQRFLRERFLISSEFALWVVDPILKVVVIATDNKRLLYDHLGSAELQELAAIYLQNFPKTIPLPFQINYQFMVPNGQLWLVSKSIWRTVGVWAHDVR